MHVRLTSPRHIPARVSSHLRSTQTHLSLKRHAPKQRHERQSGTGTGQLSKRSHDEYDIISRVFVSHYVGKMLLYFWACFFAPRPAQAGAEVDAEAKSGVTALWLAAGEGRKEVLKELLKNGASANNSRSDGITALMGAAAGGHGDVVNMLIDAGG